MESSNKCFDVFGFLSQFRAYNVSVVASGVFVYVGKSIFSSKAVRRGPGSSKLMYFGQYTGLMKMYLDVLGVFVVL